MPTNDSKNDAIFQNTELVNTPNDTNYCHTQIVPDFRKNEASGFLLRKNFVRKKRSDLPVDEEEEEKEEQCLL